MINLLRFLYRLFRKPFSYLNFYSTRFFNFVFPNRMNLIKKRIVFTKYPKFNQTTICEGAGIVEIGNKCSFGYKLGGFHRNGSIELQARTKESRIKIGNNISTNNNIFICAANYIEIGDNTLIGQNVTIMDHEAHGIQPEERRKVGIIGYIIIGQNVWLGNNVTILKNSEIGENSIVATGAVVSGKFPANVIIGGIPAKIIKVL